MGSEIGKGIAAICELLFFVFVVIASCYPTELKAILGSLAK